MPVLKTLPKQALEKAIAYLDAYQEGGYYYYRIGPFIWGVTDTELCVLGELLDDVEDAYDKWFEGIKDL